MAVHSVAPRRPSPVTRRVSSRGIEIAHKGLPDFFERGDAPHPGRSGAPRIRRILSDLDAAVQPGDLQLPDYRLHSLTGDRRGQWSVRVSGNWRIVCVGARAGQVTTSCHLEVFTSEHLPERTRQPRVLRRRSARARWRFEPVRRRRSARPSRRFRRRPPETRGRSVVRRLTELRLSDLDRRVEAPRP